MCCFSRVAYIKYDIKVKIRSGTSLAVFGAELLHKYQQKYAAIMITGKTIEILTF
jgi:hypothetical protein